MTRRSKYGCVDPMNPRAAGVCDRGGEVRRHSELLREMRWAGNRLVPTGFLCCSQHIDRPHPLDRTLILRPDPVPIRDPRPMIEPIYRPNYGTRLGVDFVLGHSVLGARVAPGDTLDTDFTVDVSGLDSGFVGTPLDSEFILDESYLA